MTVTPHPAAPPLVTADARVDDDHRPTSRRRDDLRLLFGGFVLVLGLFSDGWAHTNIAEELESFVTPYHAGIFLGFALTALVLGRVLQRGRDAGRGFAASVPQGYGPAVVAMAMFAVGFVGDGLWHTAFGIESDIDALLSPTHLLMFAALVALFTSPWRAAAARQRAGVEAADASWSARLPELLSVGLTTLTVAFFVMYVWVSSHGLATTGFVEFAERTAPRDPTLVLELSQMAFLAGSFVMTLVLVVPVVVMARRMPRLPRGTATALLVALGLAMAGMRELQNAEVLGMFLLAGVATDLVAGRAWTRPRDRLLAIGVTLPLVLWSAYWASVGLAWSIGWVPELWTGQIVFATLVGAGAAGLAATATVDVGGGAPGGT